MASSIIIDLLLRRRDLSPSINDSVGWLNFSRYGSSDLALPDRSWIVSHGCREEYYPRNNFSRCYVLNNGSSCSRLSSDVDQVVRLLFPDILVLVLLPMAARVHVALVLLVKLKLWENLHWYFQVSGSVLFGCLLKNTRLCHGRRKSWRPRKFACFF
jgi:hypothetical protein